MKEGFFLEVNSLLEKQGFSKKEKKAFDSILENLDEKSLVSLEFERVQPFIQYVGNNIIPIAKAVKNGDKDLLYLIKRALNKKDHNGLNYLVENVCYHITDVEQKIQKIAA